MNDLNWDAKHKILIIKDKKKSTRLLVKKKNRISDLVARCLQRLSM